MYVEEMATWKVDVKEPNAQLSALGARVRAKQKVLDELWECFSNVQSCYERVGQVGQLIDKGALAAPALTEEKVAALQRAIAQLKQP